MPGSKGWTMPPARRLENATHYQQIFTETIAREEKTQSRWRREHSAQSATRDLITGQEPPLNPYPQARDIGPPEAVDVQKMPERQSSKVKLIRQVEVPYQRVERVPVTVKKLIQVQVEKKMPVKKWVQDAAGSREVEGFSVVRVPEKREVEEVQYQDRVVNDTKILEVEEMQEFVWEPVPVGPSTVLKSTGVAVQGRGLTPSPMPAPAQYVSSPFLSRSQRASTPKQAWNAGNDFIQGRALTPRPYTPDGRPYTPQAQLSRPQSARPQSARPQSRQQQARQSSRAPTPAYRPQSARPQSRQQSTRPLAQEKSYMYGRAPTPQTARPSSRSRSRAATPSYMNPTKSSNSRIRTKTSAGAGRSAADVQNNWGGEITVHMGTANPVYESYRQKNGGMTPPPAKYFIDSRRYY